MSDPKNKQLYDLSTFRVLIAEDFPFVADLLSSCLVEMGVGHVQASENGEKAKEKILNFNAVSSSSNFDVLILDWLMPEMDGETLLNWIRNHRSDSIKFLPVIVCTSYASREMVEKVRDLGANEVMVKPVSAEKIARRIKYVIDNPRPYIKASDFFGPDRRRRSEAYKGEERRKTKAEEIDTHVEELE